MKVSPRTVWTLGGVDFVARPVQMHALLGARGAGKTALLLPLTRERRNGALDAC